MKGGRVSKQPVCSLHSALLDLSSSRQLLPGVLEAGAFPSGRELWTFPTLPADKTAVPITGAEDRERPFDG